MQVTQIALTDADEVASALDSYFPGVVLGSARGQDVRFSLLAHSSGFGLDIVDIDFSGQDLVIQVEATAGLMVSTAPMIQGEMVDSGVAIDVTQPYVTRAGMAARYSSARATTLSLDEKAMAAYLQKRAGGSITGAFRFTGTAPKTQQHAAVWAALTSTIGTAMRTGLADHPLLGPSMVDSVAAAYLTCFPTNWSDTDSAARSVSTASVRRAKAFIQEHAHEPISVNDIAQAARLSQRGLHSAFRSQVGVSPKVYLQQLRLERARDALQAADPSRLDSVGAIAKAAGFTHMSRFAAAYRARHGEYPSQTLRQ